MASRIFVNYRREDASYQALILADRLERALGKENVFFDVDHVPPGVLVREYLGRHVATCDAMIVIMGPRWLEILREREKTGETDYMRIEIEAALRRGIPVVPVRIDGAAMPRERDLPEDIAGLVRWSAVQMRFERFESDVSDLIAGLRHTLSMSLDPDDPKWLRGVSSSTTARPVLRSPPAGSRPSGPAARSAQRQASKPESGQEPTPAKAPLPELVWIKAGSFLMGSGGDEKGRRDNEGPQHRVTFAEPFSIGKYAITFDEFDAFCDRTGRPKPNDRGWGRGRRPVINVSFEDAESYCSWLVDTTGEGFRLPSEAEWEYCCRAGATGPYSLDGPISSQLVNCGGNRGTVEVGSLPANRWGLHEVHGNVWEWCADCWRETYDGAPSDGSAWVSGDCSRRVLRGGSWGNNRGLARSAVRYCNYMNARGYSFGFRVVCSPPRPSA